MSLQTSRLSPAAILSPGYAYDRRPVKVLKNDEENQKWRVNATNKFRYWNRNATADNTILAKAHPKYSSE